jgi:acyl dehydratase
MAFDPAALLAHEFPEIPQSYTARDAILYALGVGLGEDPLAPLDLNYLLETDLAVLPTMAVTLGTPGMWVREPKLGITVAKLVHAAQAATFHNALPPTANAVATARIASLADRGADKGAVVVLERTIRNADTGLPYCTLAQTLLLRADGGFGGAPPERVQAPTPPERAPDEVINFATSPRAALIYRLSGDWNPLHADPASAAKAGFARPILHGLCSYGVAGWVLLRAFGGARLTSLALRFAGVVYPGDVLEFSIWKDGATAFFEAKVAGRTVLDQGFAQFAQGE